jgi:hypothetical protein
MLSTPNDEHDGNQSNEREQNHLGVVEEFHDDRIPKPATPGKMGVRRASLNDVKIHHAYHHILPKPAEPVPRGGTRCKVGG